MTHILTSVEDGLGILTLNRPDRRNGIGFELAAEMRDAAEDLAMNRDVRAVLLRGEGPSFCVGGDIREMDEGYHEGVPLHQRIDILRDVTRVSEVLFHMRKPTVAALHGACAGGGLSLALACDLRIASESCKITTAFAKIGLAGDFGGSWFLTRLLGVARARELYLTSPVMTGTEAREIGLVTRVVPDGDLHSEAFALASSLARAPSGVLALMKDSLDAAVTQGLGEVLDHEARNQTLAMLTEDHREAARAFLEKRAPVFTGR